MTDPPPAGGDPRFPFGGGLHPAVQRALRRGARLPCRPDHQGGGERLLHPSRIYDDVVDLIAERIDRKTAEGVYFTWEADFV